jgi:hypothetical protein
MIFVFLPITLPFGLCHFYVSFRFHLEHTPTCLGQSASIGVNALAYRLFKSVVAQQTKKKGNVVVVGPITQSSHVHQKFKIPSLTSCTGPLLSIDIPLPRATCTGPAKRPGCRPPLPNQQNVLHFAIMKCIRASPPNLPKQST